MLSLKTNVCYVYRTEGHEGHEGVKREVVGIGALVVERTSIEIGRFS